jgi:hypothetical protein
MRDETLPLTPAEQIALWSDKLRDVSAMGLLFSKNIHDEAAFRAIQTIAMEMLALATGQSLGQIEFRVWHGDGHVFFDGANL